MVRYRLTQEQFDVICELRKNFGDTILLSDLYTHSILINDKGWMIEDLRILDLPLDQACKHLYDSNMEKLLGEKMQNVVFFSHYDLKTIHAGWNKDSYNGFKINKSDDAPELMKQALEDAISGIDVVAYVTKTAAQQDFRMQEGPLVTNPVYSRTGRFVFGNIVFRNHVTGRFHAMPRWIRIDAPRTPMDASADGMDRFARSVIDGCLEMKSKSYFLMSIIKEIQKTL